MSKTISIISQKEGAGKTTAAINIAASLALFEKKTLLIDCDPQGHLTRYDTIQPSEEVATLYDGFMAKASGRQLTASTSIDYLNFIPSDSSLSLAEHRLAIKPGKELTLRKIIREMKQEYQYVVIDPPSSLGFFTICAMAASDWSVFPVEYGPSCGKELTDLAEIVRMVQDQLNPDLKIAGILLNKCSQHDALERFIQENVHQKIPYRTFTATIPQDMNVRDANAQGKPAALFNIQSEATQAFFDCTIELMQEIDRFSFHQDKFVR